MNRSFPALRGLAIVLVVLNHSISMGLAYAGRAGFSQESMLSRYFFPFFSGLGLFAVPIFLFLSGCFFAYAAASRDTKGGYKIVWVNVKHVLIPYLIWSVIFYIEIYLIHGEKFHFVDYIKNLIVGYPYNFIPLLIFYYLISPILIRIGNRFGWILISLIGIYQLVLINTSNGALGFRFPSFFNYLSPPIISGPLTDWAIFFPLGLIYVMHSERILTVLHRLKWWLAGATVVIYLVSYLDAVSIIQAPVFRYIFPLPFILITPTLTRNSYPLIRQLEQFGKRAYGLYLMNLLFLDLILFSLLVTVPIILTYVFLLIPVLFVLTLTILLQFIKYVEGFRKPLLQRFVFG